VDVCDQLEGAIAKMDTDPELEGVNFLVWFSQGKEIRKTLRDLTFTGVFGSLLATLVLFIFLRRFSSTLVAVACIPFSLIVTCGFIWAQGRSLNTLTLLGLIVGIGMLVDNAVVVMENIFRYREEGLDLRESALRGSREVTVAVVAATLTSVIVFLPLIFNKPSEMNIYLKELGITVCLTLLASLFISQTLIPLATSKYIRSRPRAKAGWMLALERHYHRALGFALVHRWTALVAGLIVVGSAVYPIRHVDMNFDTSESELFVQVRYDFSEDLPLEGKEKVIERVEAMLEPHRAELHAKSIYSFWSDRFSLTRVYLDDGQANEDNIALVRRRLPELLPEIPGVRLEVQQNRQAWRSHMGGHRVAFQLVGDDTETLLKLAEEAITRVEAIPGLSNVETRHQEAQQELHIQPDRDLMSRYGVQSGQVGQVIGLTFRGSRLQRFRTPDGEREMRLTLDEQQTESIDQLQNLPLAVADGRDVPLSSVARLTTLPGRESIQRDNRRTSVWVNARYEDGTSEDYIPAVSAALAGMDFPYGYSWTFGQWQELRKEQSQEFLTNLLLALLLIFAVMAGLFESVRQAVALMVSLPFAVAGAAWTMYLTGTDFDQPAAIGLLLLIGIVVNNGIVMLEHINGYRRGGMERTEAMLRGGRERLRPILMTALTTLIGLVPIVVQKPSLGGVYYYSMALVIMGGLLIGTILTSLLLPAMASLSEDGFALLGRIPALLKVPFTRRSWTR